MLMKHCILPNRDIITYFCKNSGHISFFSFILSFFFLLHCKVPAMNRRGRAGYGEDGESRAALWSTDLLFPL